MNKTLALLSLALASTGAMATKCPDGKTDPSQHPDGNCNWFYEGTQPSTAGSTAEANSQAKAAAKAQSSATVGDVSNRQRQQQQQAQQQGQVLTNRNVSTSSGGAGGSVVIEGNQSGSGDRSSFVAWAPVIHGPAAPALASANLVVVPGVCGPRVRVITSQIVGQHYGPAGGRYEENRGYMETLGPWLNDDGNPGAPFVWRDGFMLGHVVTQYAAVVGTSSAASFSLGGFVDSKGLQGGAAGSGAAQQLVKSIQVSDCVYAMPKPEVVQPTVIYQTRTRTITKWRDRPVAPPCCVVPPPCCTVQNSPPLSLAK